MNVNKFVQECILSNLKEVKLQDKPACSRQTESHVSEEPEIRKKQI